MKTETSAAGTACPKGVTTPLRTAWLPLLLLLALPVVVQAQFTYTANNGTITITGYSGPGGAVTIPSAINGLPVTSIGSEAFQVLHQPNQRHDPQERHLHRIRDVPILHQPDQRLFRG